MRIITIALPLILIACCKPEIVKEPERPQDALPPAPEAPAEVENAMISNCSPTSHFGTRRATEILKLPMRWVHPQAGEAADCQMGPPGGTRPYFWITVLDRPGQFGDFTQEPGTEFDRDVVNGATRVAWTPGDHHLIVRDEKHLVIVATDPKTQAQSSTAERMMASSIAAKLLFGLQ
jgi:hypothetical protein